jgi:transport inhibitor response 1
MACRCLAELELQENDIEFRSGEWLTAFPETYTSLVSLNFSTVHYKEDYVDVLALEHLVARCPLLKKLKLNKEINLEQLQRLLLRAPNLVELGTGSYSQSLTWAELSELQSALEKCKSLRSLSGIWEVVPEFVQTLYPVCPNLITLNLSDVLLPTADFSKLISYCQKLQQLLVSPLQTLLSIGEQQVLSCYYTVPAMHEVLHLLFCIPSLHSSMSVCVMLD